LGLEKALISMKKNELSKFIIDPKYVQHKPQKKSKRHQFIDPDMFGVTPVPDISNKTLIFEIELLDFDLEPPYVSNENLLLTR
jgi:hypothetical protein